MAIFLWLTPKFKFPRRLSFFPRHTAGRVRAGSRSCRFPGFLPRPHQKSQPSFENRFWTPARPCALHSILSTGRPDSHGPGWDSQSINRDNHGSSRKSSLSIFCWPSTINVHIHRSSSPVKTPMVSLFWRFSGPGCYWIISGYCVRVGLLK